MGGSASVFSLLMALTASILAPQGVTSHLPCCEFNSENSCRACEQVGQIRNRAGIHQDHPCCKPLTRESKTERPFVAPISGNQFNDIVADVPSKSQAVA